MLAPLAISNFLILAFMRIPSPGSPRLFIELMHIAAILRTENSAFPNYPVFCPIVDKLQPSDPQNEGRALSTTIRLATEPKTVRFPTNVLKMAKANQTIWRYSAFGMATSKVPSV